MVQPEPGHLTALLTASTEKSSLEVNLSTEAKQLRRGCGALGSRSHNGRDPRESTPSASTDDAERSVFIHAPATEGQLRSWQ